MCCRSVSPGMHPDRSASSAGVSLSLSRLDSGTTTPIRIFPGPPHQFRCVTGWAQWGTVSRGCPVGSPSASMGCSWVPSSSPVSGSMFSTSSHSDSFTVCGLLALLTVSLVAVVAVVAVGLVVGEAGRGAGRRTGRSGVVGRCADRRRRGCGRWRRASRRWRRLVRERRLRP